MECASSSTTYPSEAPAEMTFSLPELNAFGGAELLSQTLHNLYTLRGAKVRDALQWANYIDASRAQAAGAEVLFNQHHWPVWGRTTSRPSSPPSVMPTATCTIKLFA